jgi:acyl-CoA ligase (AMP-forming) (exosortase A-associated)
MKPYLIQHLLEQSASSDPDGCFVSDRGRSWSRAEVLEKSLRTAALLKELGAGRGERVGVFLDKTADQVLALFGVWQAAGAAVVINPVLIKEQIVHIVRDCGLTTLVTSGAKMAQWAGALREAGIRRALVFQGAAPHGFEREIAVPAELEGVAPDRAPSPAVTDDPSHVIYTSGSTGMPKGIVVTHRNAIDGARIVSAYTGLAPGDRMLAALPFNFDYGFNQLMNAALVGGAVVLHQFLMPNDLLNALEKEKVTVFAGMPPIWLKLFNPKLADVDAPRDLSALRVLTNSGGKVPVPVVRKIRAFFPGARLFLMYGLTEAFRSTFLDPDEVDRRPDSIGKAIPNVEILVLRPDGTECAAGEEGELVHRGALITRGYWNNPEKTAEVFRPNPLLGPANAHLETVVYSGDVVRRDEEGFLTYVGRRDNMIKTKGYRVSPTEVEELMMGLAGVSECVAAGFEDADEIKLRVFVTLGRPARPAPEILLECRRRFPFYLVPDDLVVLERFPLTASGKLDRVRVAAEHGRDGKAG